MKKDGHIAVDLFSGAGGLSLGLKRAGFVIAGAIENDPVAVRTYRHNLGDHVIEAPIESVSGAGVRRRFNIEQGGCALLAGGPPCQGFSVQRNGPRHDARNALVLEYLRLVKQIRPRFFLLENVPGLTFSAARPLLSHFIDTAVKLGYAIHLRKLDAVYYGVPQFRLRTIMVGELTNGQPPIFQFPLQRYDKSSWKTVRDAIGDLDSPPLDGSEHGAIKNHYRESRLSKVNQERLKHIPPGGAREDLPVHLQLPCHTNNPTHRHLDVYGRLIWDKPAVTITARFDSFTRGRFAHPEEHRSLTLREGARIQTFPDEFVFFGNREECARQIGNAVPPKLAEIIGREIVFALNRGRRADLETNGESESSSLIA